MGARCGGDRRVDRRVFGAVGFHPAGRQAVRPQLHPLAGGGSSASGSRPPADVEMEPGGGGTGSGHATSRPEAETETSEVTNSRAPAAPDRPTRAMVEAHEVSHLPFRSWCTACVRPRAKAQQHRHAPHQDETLATVYVDYGFFRTPGETPLQSVAGKELPALIAYDRWKQAIFSHPVVQKGIYLKTDKDKVDDYLVKLLCKDLDFLGCKKVHMKRGQEPGIKAVVSATKVMWSGELIPEHAPKYEKPGNGEVQRAVQTIHGLARTLKEHVESYARTKIDPKSSLLAWIIEHAGKPHLLYHRGSDVKTAYERIKGKSWTIALPCVGESVEYRKHTKHKLEAR